MDLQSIVQLCREKQIRMVDFKTVDISGRWRHLSIPVQRLSEDTMRYGIGFDGSSYHFAPVENSDMVFIPDLDSAVVDPFTEIPTLTMIGDVMVIERPDNKPFDQYPRNVAKAAMAYMRVQGIADEMVIGPEFEFHLLDHVSFEVSPNRVAHHIDAEEADWNSRVDDRRNPGYFTPHKGGYHECLPQDVTYNLRSRMCMLMEDWGIDVKYHHHEVGGPGQVEIEVELGDMVAMADNTMVAKYIIKNAAIAAGKTATFLPKPIYGEAGNGMHVHMMLRKAGRNLFYDENGYSQLSELAHHFIGGLLRHVPSLCAFTNPSTNSYKRLVPGFEAPVTIGYATANRSAIVRIPQYAKSPEHKRFELRNPDATCNPYYAYAAILMAGLDGVRNRIDPRNRNWGPFDYNLYDLPKEKQSEIESLPRSLGEALDALERDHEYLLAGGVFSRRLIDTWITRKRAEERYISQVPHPVEFQQYFDL
ncbi:type I glutamate--ammonia ligase [Eubacteriales bacterium OttesenSCG-928-A19]|nr:type I glutamate--ammonia ligase [Eubacteriales bacterium OttesenSCG-928-A19]